MCECHGPLRDLLFASASPPRDPLDAGAVAVAGGEVHPGIHVGRIITERLFHDAVAGDEVAPIVDREKPQAADAVADRHLIGGVRLAFGQHQLLDREALPSEAMLEPRAGQREGWRVALQCPCELREEGTRQRRGGPRHVGQNVDEVGRLPFRCLQQSVGPVGGDVAVASSGGESLGHAAEVLDQGQSQHERHGPEFTEREGADRLVGGDERVDGRRVDASIRMGDQLHRDTVGPRAVGGERGELVEVRAGQEPAGGVDLLLEEVEVVEQPVRCRADASAPLVRGGE